MRAPGSLRGDDSVRICGVTRATHRGGAAQEAPDPVAAHPVFVNPITVFPELNGYPVSWSDLSDALHPPLAHRMDAPVDSPGGCAVYFRRRPERTPLYHAVQAHLETYPALAREGRDDRGGVPQYVEGEFRRYLECGILAHGLARARCRDCGHDFLIAFSCKVRGACPSCNARHMAETAAHKDLPTSNDWAQRFLAYRLR